MLQHVSVEVPPEDAEALASFWELIGFTRVDAPQALGDNVVWLERSGTQIHLIRTEGATVPVLGHAAVVVDGFDETLARVAGAGHEVAETRELWGARRAFAVGPAGHRVELMESPPPTSN